ncbi:helix-turn-helix transcriptional regulator [Humibacillus xanthopallidus]|uniref:Helix-turn-helix protein n=1 Tax=Humibacillus xanthopallidus TaxID=412689 RepID=A0A543HHZ8_9MICO|nr:helix-turn-helix transcriptional regulator [Humibacillus xanthopallidus]TQM57907.1 helix-turn-helix protein [Humibacillus xanthopallidus]
MKNPSPITCQPRRDLVSTAHECQTSASEHANETDVNRGRGVESDTMVRALDFIENHCAQPLSLTDVAEAAGVTPRGLQYAFRRMLGTTPMEYLRGVRLDRAARELSLGDPDRALTVTETAMRWGFYHPGRFAAAYLERFGEAPHETLTASRESAD